MTLKNKRIVLGVCGGIAAYKSILLLRLLKKEGAHVRVIMTKNAGYFVGPTTFEALSEKPVCMDLFEKTDDVAISHIKWADEADAVVVAPATANMIAKMANGLADDALSTFLLAVTTPVLVCPAMNTNMLLHPATQRNLETLRSDGFEVLETDFGKMACGTTGPGRLPDAEYILDRLKACLFSKDYEGKTVLVSAGPTREFIDPVRFISNPSSGKMGYAIARAAEQRGARVILVSGPTALEVPYHVESLPVDSARDMAKAVFENMDRADVIIKTAAVGDYRAKTQADQKIKKQNEELILELVQNQDILKELGARKTRQFLVGFAAETRDLAANAGEKLKKKNLDIIVGNLVGSPDSGFQADTNKVTLFFKDGSSEALPLLGKDEVAHILLDRILEKNGN
ncbi:MAG: bifunctional phosphopantothenoylcysteine decarboxylase/phosphopantothenate--cysteine ligase CoaBC [Proteobacteria bacterium]|nr:bifunctional phosphopantothenoylcysteine decarboxylase/phosphopantothenate--cysteine ligase CoaBC [Pseudomonadota bacterium]MBU4472205.1 bifunctional phosphopantothenoylcysteine decarboxylase/phosphopantothenate--cysteine ligase CoaBC [Pseudomonadota bacterium]MCG2750414.1 bifunctional phosphopantothenoylcysteine decarboxylase/phosphopantothenate--cysteine ligase CoaBC [Desulfobacteraceae bacterium]